mgnify:CR=1
MSTFNLEIVATDKVFYKGECESLVFPGLDGEHGILRDHEVMVSAVKAGELRYKVDGKTFLAAVGDGFIEVLGDKVILISDFVERPEEIDAKRAQLAKERAEERIRLKNSKVEYVHSQAALARAMARLKVSNKIK